MKFKPLLAAECSQDLSSLRFPLAASPKLDGIRCIIKDSKALTRSLKEIPNLAVFLALSQPYLEGMDGELVVGDPTDPDVYRKTNSQIMSKNGGAEGVTFYVFDNFTDPDAIYKSRLKFARAGVTVAEQLRNPVLVRMLTQYEVNNIQDVEHYEEQVLNSGGEGIMLRDQLASYKFGRSTLRQQTLLKLKRFSHDEAVVLEQVEEMANLNEATTNALGHTERSSHQENKVGKNRLGSILVRDLKTGVEFNIGSGFTGAERDEYWKRPITGRVVRYKHFPIGVKDLPRFPTFDGLRDEEDL